MDSYIDIENIIRREKVLGSIENGQALHHYGSLAWTMEKDGKLVSTKKDNLKNARKNRAFLEIVTQNALITLDQVFEEEQITCVILKGMALAHRYYNDPLHRSFGDIDLLVSPEDKDKARKLLLQIGAYPEDTPGKWEGNNFKEVFYFGKSVIELHTGILVYRDTPELFSERLRPVAIPGIRWLQEPDPEFLFVYLCGHGAFQHMFDELYWLFDLDQLIRKESHLNWEKIRQDARRLGLEKAVGVTLAVLRKHLNTPMPAEVIEKPIGSDIINTLYPYYITPERIVGYAHREGTAFYLLLKALLRKSIWEAFKYGIKRTFYR